MSAIDRMVMDAAKCYRCGLTLAGCHCYECEFCGNRPAQCICTPGKANWRPVPGAPEMPDDGAHGRVSA